MSGVDPGSVTGYEAIVAPFCCEVNIASHAPEDVKEAMGVAVASFAASPPFWVTQSWERSLVVSTRKSPRSKPRSSVSPTVSSKSVLQAARRVRTNPLFGLLVDYKQPEPLYYPPVPWTMVSAYSFGDELWTSFKTFCTPAMRSDPRFGPAVWQIACSLIEAGGRLIRGSGWFGSLDWEPFHRNQGFPARDSVGTGYPYVGCFTGDQVAALGGSASFGSAPISKWEAVVNAAGEECVVTLLADTFDAVTDELLRAWRAFLVPVLSTDAPANRQRTWQRFPDDPSWNGRPVHILPEDWPV